MMKIEPQMPVERMDRDETAQCRGWARLAEALHPGAVGKLLAREFDDYAAFGYRLGSTALVVQAGRALEAEAARRHTAQRERWAAETASEAVKHQPAPGTPAPPRTSVRDALRAAQDAITGRAQQ